MTEQYEQITDWNGWMAAYREGTLCHDNVPLGKGICLRADNIGGVQADLDAGRYYRKVEPEEVEFIEIGNRNGRRFYVESPSILPFVVPDEWNPTGYIIKGVRVKA